MIKVRQYIPTMVDTNDPPMEWRVDSAEDLERIPWIAGWKDTPPHQFDHYAIANDGRLLLAVFDNGQYWWVLAFLSAPIPGLPVWERPNDAGKVASCGTKPALENGEEVNRKMNVTFTQEYRDPETGRTHKANEQAEVPDEKARKLIQEGKAQESSGAQQSGQQKQR